MVQVLSNTPTSEVLDGDEFFGVEGVSHGLVSPYSHKGDVPTTRSRGTPPCWIFASSVPSCSCRQASLLTASPILVGYLEGARKAF